MAENIGRDFLYLHYLSFLNIKMAQEFEILPWGDHDSQYHIADLATKKNKASTALRGNL